VVAVIGGFWILATVNTDVPVRKFDGARDVKIYRSGDTRNAGTYQPKSGNSGRASVIDGDTIEIHGQRIRFWGIDTPESSQRCVKDGKPWRCGTDSANALAGFLSAQTVTCEKRDTDRYGRTVAVCKVAGEDVGAWLVQNGWALDFTRYSHGAYAAQQSKAKNEKRGIWQGEFEPPWEWRRNNR